MRLEVNCGALPAKLHAVLAKPLVNTSERSLHACGQPINVTFRASYHELGVISELYHCDIIGYT